MSWTGQRLRDARARRGWTQARLAEELGAGLRTVAAWERDEAKPQAQWVVKLNDLLNDDTDDAPADQPLDPRTIERALRSATVMELLAELAGRIAQLEAGRTPTQPSGFAPERVKWRTEDAPAAEAETYEWPKTASSDEAL